MSITFFRPINDYDTKYTITLSPYGVLLGTTVSAIVYTSLSTAGDMLGTVTETGLELTGKILEYGTEATMGSTAANTVKLITNTYGKLLKPTISKTAQLSAIGISIIAGAGTALTTTALIYGGKQAGSYIYEYLKNYNIQLTEMIQTPIKPEIDIVMIEDEFTDDLQIIEAPSSTHSPQD
jgi:hypothetical protein